MTARKIMLLIGAGWLAATVAATAQRVGDAPARRVTDVAPGAVVDVSFRVPVTNGLALHLAADAIMDLNHGDRVARWDDLSGHGHHVAEADINQQPWYLEHQVQGLPVLEFRQGQWLRGAYAPLNQPTTHFTVWSILPESTHAYPYALDSNDGTRRQAIYHGDNRVYLFAGSSAGYVKAKPFDMLVTSGIFNGANSRIYENGEFKATVNAGTQAMGGITIGGRFNEPRFYGRIAEILIYDRALSDAERQRVERYLGGKWLLGG